MEAKDDGLVGRMTHREMTPDEIEQWKCMVPQVIKLSPEAWDRFMEMLENPPAPNQKLIDLMKERDWVDE